ncbi:hypothetical protein C1A50_2101 [Paenibacillus polymyxa]|nr:hypothetical protein C1A50_2101 [Paenibacillus polymyxa]
MTGGNADRYDFSHRVVTPFSLYNTLHIYAIILLFRQE